MWSSMTYKVGKFVPSDRAEMGESTLPLELLLSWRNPKDAGVSRGTQLTRRDVKAKEIRQVQRCSIWDNIIAQGGNFAIDSLSYWKPVLFSQKWLNVCAFGGFENESSRTILNLYNSYVFHKKKKIWNAMKIKRRLVHLAHKCSNNRPLCSAEHCLEVCDLAVLHEVALSGK